MSTAGPRSDGGQPDPVLPVSKLLTTKCLTMATTFRRAPRTYAAPRTPVRYGSSPNASACRPPNGVRAISSAGPSRTLWPAQRASWATRGPEPLRELFVEARRERHARGEGGRVVGHPDAITPVGKTQRRQPEVSHRG